MAKASTLVVGRVASFASVGRGEVPDYTPKHLIFAHVVVEVSRFDVVVDLKLAAAEREWLILEKY